MSYCSAPPRRVESYMRSSKLPKKLVVYDLDNTLIESHLTEVTCHTCDGEKMVSGPGQPVEYCTTCKGRGYNLKPHPDYPYDTVTWLPGRRIVLRRLDAAGFTQAIATNQAGVAWGHQTPEQVIAKLARVRKDVGIPLPAKFAMHAPGATVSHFMDPRFFSMRKPEPGMLLKLMEEQRVEPKDTIFVGDMEMDRLAAEAAGVRYYDTADWFMG